MDPNVNTDVNLGADHALIYALHYANSSTESVFHLNQDDDSPLSNDNDSLLSDDDYPLFEDEIDSTGRTVYKERVTKLVNGMFMLLTNGLYLIVIVSLLVTNIVILAVFRKESCDGHLKIIMMIYCSFIIYEIIWCTIKIALGFTFYNSTFCKTVYVIDIINAGSSLILMSVALIFMTSFVNCPENAPALFVMLLVDVCVNVVANLFLVCFSPCLIFMIRSRVVEFVILKWDNSAVSKLPMYIFKDNKIIFMDLDSISVNDKELELTQVKLTITDVEDAQCYMCMNEYKNGDMLRVLDCNHHVHLTCIDTWLKIKNECPVCRTLIDI